jgi:hypothetical protein
MEMLGFRQIEARREALADLLARLQAGEIECVEYGKPGQQYMSYLRIRYMNTAGGLQFGIRTLSHGIEGSGDYTPDAGAALQKALDAVIHYHRPAGSKIQAALRELRAKNGKPEVEADDLSFFAVTESSTHTGRRRLIGPDPLSLEGEVVVELRL